MSSVKSLPILRTKLFGETCASHCVTASKVFSNLIFPVTQDWKRPVRNALNRHVIGEETLQGLR